MSMTPAPATGSVIHLNPEELRTASASSQVVLARGPVRTVFVSAQSGINRDGEIVSPSDAEAQLEQALSNLEAALRAADARLDHVVKWTVQLIQGQSAQRVEDILRKVWSQRSDPPAFSLFYVAGFADPNCLVQIEAIAVVTEGVH